MTEPRNRTVEVLNSLGSKITPMDLERVARAAYADGTQRALLYLQDRFAGERLTAFLREHGSKFPMLHGEVREDLLVLLRTTIALVGMGISEELALMDADRARL